MPDSTGEVLCVSIVRPGCLAAMGDFPGALRDYDTALRIDPCHPHALSYRATDRLTSGDIAGAIADYERLLDVSQGDMRTDAHYGLACSLARRSATRSAGSPERAGDVDKALANLQQAIARGFTFGDRPKIVGQRLFENPRSLLHIVTDWPGNWKNSGEMVRVLVGAGGDPNVTLNGNDKSETPLHWAASSNDVAGLRREDRRYGWLHRQRHTDRVGHYLPEVRCCKSTA